MTTQEIKIFQKKILQWYGVNKRNLPWRKTRDPYKILISEVMSQQTQINRVAIKYEAWLERFPSITELAHAKVVDVLIYWSGLGYNRRALNLKKTAEIIVNNFNGKFPYTEKELLELPGIGKYTACAMLCFAFDQQVAVVDTNIRKIIITQFGIEGNEKKLQEIADQLLPQGQAYEWNQALMDYAAAVLKKEKISVPKQSKFIGSHRYYRGKVLKLIIQQKKVTVKDLGKILKKDFSDKDGEWLKNLLEELIDEGFIVKSKNTLALAS